MSLQFSSPKSLLISLTVFLALLALVRGSRALPTDQKPEPLSFAEAGLMLPKAEECRDDEKPAIGLTPSSEPTCLNPTPVQLRMFIYDYVPCFCKDGFVREVKSRRCIKVEDCPK